MLKPFKIGTGMKTSVRIAAILLTALGWISPAKLHGEERRTETARLQIQVIVMPTVLAAKQAQTSRFQPSQSLLSFNLGRNAAQTNDQTTKRITITNPDGTTQFAVLETSTIVAN